MLDSILSGEACACTGTSSRSEGSFPWHHVICADCVTLPLRYSNLRIGAGARRPRGHPLRRRPLHLARVMGVTRPCISAAGRAAFLCPVQQIPKNRSSHKSRPRVRGTANRRTAIPEMGPVRSSNFRFQRFCMRLAHAGLTSGHWTAPDLRADDGANEKPRTEGAHHGVHHPLERRQDAHARLRRLPDRQRGDRGVRLRGLARRLPPHRHGPVLRQRGGRGRRHRQERRAARGALRREQGLGLQLPLRGREGLHRRKPSQARHLLPRPHGPAPVLLRRLRRLARAGGGIRGGQGPRHRRLKLRLQAAHGPLRLRRRQSSSWTSAPSPTSSPCSTRWRPTSSGRRGPSTP